MDILVVLVAAVLLVGLDLLAWRAGFESRPGFADPQWENRSYLLEPWPHAAAGPRAE